MCIMRRLCHEITILITDPPQNLFPSFVEKICKNVLLLHMVVIKLFNSCGKVYHMALKIFVISGSGNGSLPESIKPLPDPMLTSQV